MTQHLDLKNEWAGDLNTGLEFTSLTPSSTMKVWWRCSKDSRHVWQATVQKRSQGQGCPVCRNLLILPGVNDLETLHPELVKEIYQTNSKYLDPSATSAGSALSIEWLCSKGHIFKNSIRNRTKGQNCPFCSGKSLASGFNDFATRFPELARELSKEQTNKFDPSLVFPSSKIIADWFCSRGHTWKKSIASRAIDGTGCPECLNDFRKLLRTGQQKQVRLESESLQIKFPSVAQEWDSELNSPLKPSEIYFADNKSRYWWKCKRGHSFLASVVGKRYGAKCSICSNRTVKSGFNDVASQLPHLAGEFAIENGYLKPSMVLSTSDEKYFWTCALGHLYSTSPRLRSRGQGCPFCSNKRVLSGFNDFQTLAGEGANQWNYSRNGTIRPDAILAKSTKTFWWICDLGHEWQAQPFRRLVDSSCPYCVNRKLLQGFNDIGTRYPLLLAEWDSNANEALSLNDLVAKNHEKFAWACHSGHKWTASLVNRINGSGCPSCASFGFNPNMDAIFYLIINPELGAFKIGITNLGNNRLEIWNRLGWKTLFQASGEGRIILATETHLLRWLRKDLGLQQALSQNEMGGHNGATETFSLELLDEKLLIQKAKTQLKA
jgi:hypothetical protein